MFSKFNEKVNTVFLDTNSQEIQTQEKLNVILSPSLYWVKKISLPVKYVRDVKPLLESLFEDTLPEGKYSYFTYKKEDFFYIFAYEDKKILDLFKEKGLALAQVNGVYFAQSEFDAMQKGIQIDENQTLFLNDGVVILLPSNVASGQSILNLDSIELSKHKIALNQFGHIVNNKHLYKLLGGFLVLIGLVSLEFLIVMHKISTTESLQEELFAKNNLQPTMMQNRALLKEYSTIYEKQTKFREVLGVVLSIPLQNTQKISELNLKGNKFTVEFLQTPKGKESAILRILDQQKLKYVLNFKENVLQVEISL